MLIILILGVGLLTGIGLLVFVTVSRYCHDVCEIVGGALTVVFSLFIAIALFIHAAMQISAPMFVASSNMRYDSLTYQWENEFYDNDNDVGKQELVDQIRQWNEDLAEGKLAQHNIWVGWFVPNVYDDFEFISLEGSK